MTSYHAQPLFFFLSENDNIVSYAKKRNETKINCGDNRDNYNTIYENIQGLSKYHLGTDFNISYTHYTFNTTQ